MIDATIEDMLCKCGCGVPTSIAKQTRRAIGHVRGAPVRFIHGHHRRGAKWSKETRRKNSGPNASAWKGGGSFGYGQDTVGGISYTALHAWLRRVHPKTGICEHCGADSKTDYAKKKDAQYTRNRDDYLELCRPCHRKYDYAKEKK